MTKAKIISKLIIIVVLIGLITGAGYYQYLLLTDKDSNIIINRITAQIISVSKDTVTIRDDKNSEYKLDKSLLNDSKNLIFGNDITISYTGDIKSEYEIINSKVTENKIINADISLDKRKELSNIVQAMTIEDKAGQLLLVLDSKNLLTDQTMSGCVLFEDDFANKSRNEVIENIERYQSNAKYPMIIAVDEEGGSVVRVSKYLRDNRFRLPQDVYKSGGMDSIISDATEKSEYLKEFGINVNLAPVADVATNEDDYIYRRSFGVDVDATSNYVRNVVMAMSDIKMGSVLKHFPGYGSAPGSGGTYHDSRDFNSLKNNDLLPFKAGIEAGANSILVTNNIIDSVDNQNPATLSKDIHDLLREDLKYNGVIMTDDVTDLNNNEFGNDSEIVIKAIKAGNDLIMTSRPQIYFESLITAINNGEICLNELDLSVLRVIAWKDSLDIL
ncbi:glycoside hydrolase family 3 N-terminal domain-containing protein [uncultured Thomasclavelia sp.]|uniref:glycoside hydrolase family 3 N-terminal domain-containing protein n=1 Tax=uncultured Thomasclavelia sp. TaxID=3025759 RepID=UPI002604D18C|nr:glycoside hydrolase family 3 N-terminal domain-containing protein [uncultured Thomasclavelia sp.]